MHELMLQFLFLHCDREARVLGESDYISQLFYLIYAIMKLLIRPIYILLKIKCNFNYFSCMK